MKKIKLKYTTLGIIIGIMLTISTVVIAATYKFKAEEVEYIPNDTNWAVGNVQEAMNEMYTLYRIKKKGSSGIFSVSDNMLATGYMKSTATDNNVIFGGYCWKVIRVTDNDEVRMLYNGMPIDGQCTRTGTDTQIGTSKYSTTYNVTAYNSSTVKGVVDNWYNTNLATNYGDKISAINLITREEASTVGGGYLVSGEQYWTQSAYGNNVTTTGSCSYNQCGGSGSCTSYSGGIYTVNTSGSIVTNNNGTYSSCSPTNKTCNGSCTGWMKVNNQGKCSSCSSVVDFNSGCSCCTYAILTGSCTATPQGSSLAVRPVITLKASAQLQGGEGTTTNPYVMK